METHEKAKRCVEVLKLGRMKVTTAESCTGGMIASELVACEGCSEVFSEGFVTYSNAAKMERLSVKPTTLKEHGAVSKRTAYEMAKGAMATAGADYALSTTGYADNAEDKTGLVYICLATRHDSNVYKCHFKGTRNEVRKQAAAYAIKLLYEALVEKV